MSCPECEGKGDWTCTTCGPDGTYQKFQGVMLEAAGEYLKEHQDKYYQYKVDAGRLLSPNEIALADYVSDKYPGGRALEFGCGFGQLTALLQLLGLQAMGIEAILSRFEGAQHLRLACMKDLRLEYSLLFGTYPQDKTPPFDVLVVTNIASSWWDSWDASLQEKYRRTLQGRPAVIDTRLWWTVRETPEEQAALIDEICSQGYKANRVYATTVYEFTPAR